MKERKRAAKAAFITQFMLELYHLDAVIDKERVIIEDALLADNEIKTRYDELKKLDIEIKNKYKLNNTHAFNVVNNNNERIINKTNKLNKRKTFIGIGIAAIILCLFIPIFIYFSNSTKKGADTGIAKNVNEHNIEEEQTIIIDNNINADNERNVILPNETRETEIKTEDNRTNRTVIETAPVVIAEVPNDTGVYIRGGSDLSENKPQENTEQNNISIPAGITFIFDSMFANSGLTGINIPERITLISNNAFANNHISTVIIPQNVASIGSKAFFNNPLISVTIGANVHIEDDSFPGQFNNSYNANGKTAGTYIRINSTSNEWRKQ